MAVVYASMVDKITGDDVVTGIMVKVTPDGGIQVDGQGILEHEGNGQWSYRPTLVELANNSLGVLFFGNNSVPQSITIISDNPLVFTSQEFKDAPGAYADIEYADIFLQNNILDNDLWLNSPNEKKLVCLNQATCLIDLLNIKGKKTDPDQPRKFPRDPDTVVPTEVRSATALIANEILNGKNIERGYVSVNQEDINIGPGRMSKSTDPLITDIIGIPSYLAWKFLRKYILKIDTFEFIRVN